MTATTVQVAYTVKTPVGVPVEVTFNRGPQVRAAGLASFYTLTAWCSPQGTVGYSLVNSASGQAQALSTLQADPSARFPGKAVPGWQAEVVAFAQACLYPIETIR